MKALCLASLVSVFAASCAHAVNPPPPPPPVIEPPAATVPWAPDDAGTAEASSASPCAKACATFTRLGCPEALVTANGTSCTTICVHGETLRKAPTACWAAAVNVTELRACGAVRCLGK